MLAFYVLLWLFFFTTGMKNEEGSNECVPALTGGVFPSVCPRTRSRWGVPVAAALLAEPGCLAALRRAVAFALDECVRRRVLPRVCCAFALFELVAACYKCFRFIMIPLCGSIIRCCLL